MLLRLCKGVLGFADALSPPPSPSPAGMARGLRVALQSEHDAAALYDSLAEAAERLPDGQRMAAVLRSIAEEEVAHVGELTQLIMRLDPTEAEALTRGAVEAADMMGGE